MDPLPNEIQSKILTHLTLNERVNCRLVSRRLKSSVDFNLKTLTGIHVIDEWQKPLCGPSASSFVQEKYLSKPLTRVKIRYRVNKKGKKCLDPDLICFLGKLSPNLSVLQAGHLYGSLEDLLPIAASLRFFSLGKCTFGDTDQLMDKFEQLECFHLQRETEDSYKASASLLKKLIREGRPICLLKNPSPVDIDEANLKLFAANGVKSAIFDDSQDQLHSISRTLAQNLLDLSISFIPRIDFCQGELSSLKYLKIDRKYQEDTSEAELYTDLLFTSPLLRYFSYRGRISTKLLNRLFEHFHLLEHLKVLELVDLTGLRETPKLSLPQHLESFTLKSHKDFELTNAFSSSLLSFTFQKITKLVFDFSNLKELKIRASENSLASDLATSLSKSNKLKVLELDFLLDQFSRIKYSHLQLILDTFDQMTQLEHIRIRSFIENAHLMPALVLKQSNISNVRSLRWETEGKIQFYPMDIFDSLKITQEIAFTSSHGICFTFRPQKFVFLHFENEMSQLESLEFEWSASNENLLSDVEWSKCSRVKNLDTRLGQSLTHLHINYLIKMMTELQSLEIVLVRDWHMYEEEVEAEREVIVLKQENIPSVKKFYWNVRGHLHFYPTDVFLSFIITKNIGIFLENRREDVSFHFEKRELVSILLTTEMKRLNLLSIPSLKLMDRQFLEQMKYLRKVKRLYLSHRFWNTSCFTMILIRRFLLIRQSITSGSHSHSS